MIRQAIALATSALTIWGMWLAGSKNWRGWAVGLGNQALWLAFIIVFGAWGLLPLSVALVFIYSRNLLRWKRDPVPVVVITEDRYEMERRRRLSPDRTRKPNPAKSNRWGAGA